MWVGWGRGGGDSPARNRASPPTIGHPSWLPDPAVARAPVPQMSAAAPSGLAVWSPVALRLQGGARAELSKRGLVRGLKQALPSRLSLPESSASLDLWGATSIWGWGLLAGGCFAGPRLARKGQMVPSLTESPHPVMLAGWGSHGAKTSDSPHLPGLVSANCHPTPSGSTCRGLASATCLHPWEMHEAAPTWWVGQRGQGKGSLCICGSTGSRVALGSMGTQAWLSRGQL